MGEGEGTVALITALDVLACTIGVLRADVAPEFVAEDLGLAFGVEFLGASSIDDHSELATATSAGRSSPELPSSTGTLRSLSIELLRYCGASMARWNISGGTTGGGGVLERVGILGVVTAGRGGGVLERVGILGVVTAGRGGGGTMGAREGCGGVVGPGGWGVPGSGK